MLILIRPYALNHSGNHRCTLGGAGMGPAGGQHHRRSRGRALHRQQVPPALPRPGSR
jgi:hypothetical protein